VNRSGPLLLATLAIAACAGPRGLAGGETTTTPPVAPTTVSSTTTTKPPTTTTTLPTVLVTGKVARPDGTPVARAVVQMGELRSTTGPDGWFSFETSAPTSMTVHKPGWSTAEVGYDRSAAFLNVTMSPQTIRGIRVSPESAGSDEAFAALLGLARDTAVNALVFDTKREGGNVLYDTTVTDAHEIGSVSAHYDARERVAQAHEAGLYVITRIVAFEDGARVSSRPEEKLAGAWLDPTSETARRYILDLAIEACEIGFDEIQFDYVRYPAGRTAEVSGQNDLTQEQRVTAIASFLSAARDALHALGCAVSADVFGIVVSTPDDQGLGQRPEELSAQIDALSPMIYPSHYSLGWLGFADPNDHPYDVTADAIRDSLPRLDDGAILRPWLQAFWWTDAQIRSSIQAAEDLGVGWMLWNILSNFDPAAIPTDAEVGP